MSSPNKLPPKSFCFKISYLWRENANINAKMQLSQLKIVIKLLKNAWNNLRMTQHSEKKVRYTVMYSNQMFYLENHSNWAFQCFKQRPVNFFSLNAITNTTLLVVIYWILFNLFFRFVYLIKHWTFHIKKLIWKVTSWFL